MKRNFTPGLAVFVLMALMTAVVNAQDADNPWHLIAFENDVEVAFYNTGMITGMEATVQNVTIVLDNGKTFSHPVATTTFGFDPRKEGTATANETVIVPAWSVFFANDRLHFSEPVSSVSIFTMYGALVARFEGNITEVPVNLPQGFYIVEADGKSAKLLVNNSGNGSAPAQPLLESQPVANTSNPVNLRAGVLMTYWNITAGGTITPVEMAQVAKFYFTPENSIVFILKNGNTIELADYQGVKFTVELATGTTSSNWDLDRTIAIGGGSRGIVAKAYGEKSLSSIFLAAIHSNGIILFDNDKQKETKYLKENIHPDMWPERWPEVLPFYANYKKIITFWDCEAIDAPPFREMGLAIKIENDFFFMIASSDGKGMGIVKDFGADAEIEIPSSIKVNTNGTITITAAGVTHIFKW